MLRLSELNISGDLDTDRPSATPRPTDTDGAHQVLLAFLNAGLCGRYDQPVHSGWDKRSVAHVRVTKDLPAAAPFDDEIREVLPSLAAAQRADPFTGPVLSYLHITGTSQSAEWMQTPVPSNPPPGTEVTTPTSTTTLLDISSQYFLDDDGILVRNRNPLPVAHAQLSLGTDSDDQRRPRTHLRPLGPSTATLDVLP